MSDTRIPGNHGFKVALPGFNALTATPEQSAVHSGFLSPKVDATKYPKGPNPHYGTLNVGFAGSPPSDFTDVLLFSTAHGYSYTPSVLGTIGANFTTVVLSLPAGYINAGLDGIGGTGFGNSNIFLEVFVRTNATTCDFFFTYDSANDPFIPNLFSVGATLAIRWYLFAENGT